MSKEKRKFVRSQCVLPAELIKIEGKDHLTVRTTAHDLSDEGLKLTISGEIIRVKSSDKKLEVGLKIKEIDNNSKREILTWVFPSWLKEKE
jgi:hypothetical protein